MQTLLDECIRGPWVAAARPPARRVHDAVSHRVRVGVPCTWSQENRITFPETRWVASLSPPRAQPTCATAISDGYQRRRGSAQRQWGIADCAQRLVLHVMSRKLGYVCVMPAAAVPGRLRVAPRLRLSSSTISTMRENAALPHPHESIYLGPP